MGGCPCISPLLPDISNSDPASHVGRHLSLSCPPSPPPPSFPEKHIIRRFRIILSKYVHNTRNIITKCTQTDSLGLIVFCFSFLVRRRVCDLDIPRFCTTTQRHIAMRSVHIRNHAVTMPICLCVCFSVALFAKLPKRVSIHSCHSLTH